MVRRFIAAIGIAALAAIGVSVGHSTVAHANTNCVSLVGSLNTWVAVGNVTNRYNDGYHIMDVNNTEYIWVADNGNGTCTVYFDTSGQLTREGYGGVPMWVDGGLSHSQLRAFAQLNLCPLCTRANATLTGVEYSNSGATSPDPSHGFTGFWAIGNNQSLNPNCYAEVDTTSDLYWAETDPASGLEYHYHGTATVNWHNSNATC